MLTIFNVYLQKFYVLLEKIKLNMREKKILTTNVFLQNLLFFRNNRIKYEGWGGGEENLLLQNLYHVLSRSILFNTKKSLQK